MTFVEIVASLAKKPGLLRDLRSAVDDEAKTLHDQGSVLGTIADAAQAAQTFYAEEITEYLNGTARARRITPFDVLHRRRAPVAKAIATLMLEK